jgi:hypothetical protein
MALRPTFRSEAIDLTWARSADGASSLLYQLSWSSTGRQALAIRAPPPLLKADSEEADMTIRRLLKGASAAAATVLCAYLTIWVHASFGRGPLHALLVNWIAMSWIALLGQGVDFRLPSGYYSIRAFEHDGTAYERLGIRLFKRLVRRGPLAWLNPRLRYPNEPTPSALQRLDGEMRRSEAGHVAVFATVCIGAGISLLAGSWPAAAWLMLFNVPFNLYPVILQRYNRLRLQERRALHGHQQPRDKREPDLSFGAVHPSRRLAADE